jgi:hypothetical protein
MTRHHPFGERALHAANASRFAGTEHARNAGALQGIDDDDPANDAAPEQGREARRRR